MTGRTAASSRHDFNPRLTNSDCVATGRHACHLHFPPLTSDGFSFTPASGVADRGTVLSWTDLGHDFKGKARIAVAGTCTHLNAKLFQNDPLPNAISVSGGIVIATKACDALSAGAWDRNRRPEHLRTACERSLRRLKLERSISIGCTRPIPACRWKILLVRSPPCKPRQDPSHGLSNVNVDVTGEAVLLAAG